MTTSLLPNKGLPLPYLLLFFVSVFFGFARVGTWNYLWNDPFYSYNDWITNAANDITHYWNDGWYWNPSPPPAQVYNPPAINNYPTNYPAGPRLQ